MNDKIALILMVSLIVFAVFCGWRGARPPNLSKGPRLMPWRGLMVTSAAISLLLLAYIAAQGAGGFSS